jgi:hypothetical protein
MQNFSVKVVSEASDKTGMDHFFEINADHNTVCKPSSKQAEAYVYLEDFLSQILTTAPMVG